MRSFDKTQTTSCVFVTIYINKKQILPFLKISFVAVSVNFFQNIRNNFSSIWKMSMKYMLIFFLGICYALYWFIKIVHFKLGVAIFKENLRICVRNIWSMEFSIFCNSHLLIITFFLMSFYFANSCVLLVFNPKGQSL